MNSCGLNVLSDEGCRVRDLLEHRARVNGFQLGYEFDGECQTFEPHESSSEESLSPKSAHFWAKVACDLNEDRVSVAWGCAEVLGDNKVVDDVRSVIKNSGIRYSEDTKSHRTNFYLNEPPRITNQQVMDLLEKLCDVSSEEGDILVCLFIYVANEG
jgi:hypothetical protein